MITAEKRCEGTRGDGALCRAHPLTASRFCFAHDPAQAAKRKAAWAAALVGGREARAARQLRPLRGIGMCCPRCASRDVASAGELPKRWSCRACGYRF